MEHREVQRERLYSAFISYSRRDAKLAKRLQQRIERYRLPRRIARAAGFTRLKPVFRDRDDLCAAPDLSEALREALGESEHLIVVCTPHSAHSEWVGREIEFFRETDGDRHILPALFAGTSDTAFHPALRNAADGSHPHPLAADFRRGGDGRLALLKLVAVLAHVRLDELVQRDAQRRLRQFVVLAAAILIATVAASALVMETMRARSAAEMERLRGSEAVDFQLKELRAKLEAAGRLDLLEAVNRGVARYYEGQSPDTLPIPAQLQRAELLQANAKDDEQRGNLAAARRDVTEAWRSTATLLAAHPQDSKVVYAHAQSEFWLGFIDWRRGDTKAAEASFRRYADQTKQLMRLEPANLDWRQERGYANSNLGMLVLRESRDTVGARKYFTEAQADFLTVARLRPDDADLRYDIADGEAWLADVERLGGNFAGALHHREVQQEMLQALLLKAPRNARYRSGSIGNTLALARIAAAERRFDSALAQLEAAHAAAAELAAADPDNVSVARQKRAIELFQVQTWLTIPAAQRPPGARIANVLGDCAAEREKPNNDELAGFCSVLSARALLARNDRDAARRSLAEARDAESSRALTERWRLDLHADRLELARLIERTR